MDLEKKIEELNYFNKKDEFNYAIDRFKERVTQNCWINDRYENEEIEGYLNNIKIQIEREVNNILKKLKEIEEIKVNEKEENLDKIIEVENNLNNRLKKIKENKNFIELNKEDFIKSIKKQMYIEDEIMRSSI